MLHWDGRWPLQSLTEWIGQRGKPLAIVSYLLVFSFVLLSWITLLFVIPPVGVAAAWVGSSLLTGWATRPGRRRRILIYLAAASLWISIALDNRSGLDGLLSASLLTAFALAFWGAYCIFPEVLDALRTHFGRRVPR